MANIPMLPVVAGIESTKWAIFKYTLILVAITLVSFLLFKNDFGYIYLFSSVLMGGLFIWYVVKLLRTNGIEGAKTLYLFSIAYLGILFISIVIDSVLFEVLY